MSSRKLPRKGELAPKIPCGCLANHGGCGFVDRRWAHLRRDFQAIIDRKNAGRDIGTSLLENSDSLFMHRHFVRKKEVARETFPSETRSWLREK